MDEQVNGQEALVQVRAVRPRIADLRRNLPPPPSHERAHRPRRALASHIVCGVAEVWWWGSKVRRRWCAGAAACKGAAANAPRARVILAAHVRESRLSAPVPRSPANDRTISNACGATTPQSFPLRSRRGAACALASSRRAAALALRSRRGGSSTVGFRRCARSSRTKIGKTPRARRPTAPAPRSLRSASPRSRARRCGAGPTAPRAAGVCGGGRGARGGVGGGVSARRSSSR